ncbi:MAG: alpha/beta fold hydrolase [Deltaproteobacteria bacterium]
MENLSPQPSPRRLALLHGFLGAPGSWDRVRAHLAGSSVETPCLLGHDGAARGAATFEEELARLWRAHAPWPETLVGYSLGARVALGLAARAPRPFARRVLVSGRDGLRDAEEARVRRAADDALAEALRAEGLEAFVDRWQAQPLFASQSALPDEVRAAHRARRLAHDPAAVAEALSVLSLGRMPSFGALAVARTARVELVVGARDPKFRQIAEELAREHGGRRNVRVHVVPDAGHDLVLERPEALAAILEDRA